MNQIPESFWGLRLALKVLEQRALGQASGFHPYISHLPPAVQGLPMFFSGAHRLIKLVSALVRPASLGFRSSIWRSEHSELLSAGAPVVR